MAEDHKIIFKQKRLNTRLLKAVYSKDFEKVKAHIANGAHPDTQCQVSLLSCTHLAAYLGTVNILEELLNKGVNLTTRDKNGLQPHHLAALSNRSLKCLKIILDKQNDLIESPVILEQTKSPLRDEVSDNYDHNHNDLANLIQDEIKEGATALFIATKKGLTEVVKELLKRDASVTEEILDLAGKQNDISIMLNATHRNHPKMGQLQMAVFKGNVEDVFQCLKNLRDEEQVEPTLLHLAVQNKLKNESNKDDYNEILVMLLDTKNIINLNHRDENNKTPLYLATEGKWMDDIYWLLEYNADENIQCQNGETVFHVAAKNKNFNILKYLLETKPDSNALKVTDNEDYTPLYRAIESGSVDCVLSLLKTATNDDYKLTIKGREITILHAAIESSSLNRHIILQKILTFLMEKNLSESVSVLNETNSEGLTAVDLAAKNGEGRCLDVLFKCDNINVIPTNIDINKNHDTALHHAAQKGYFACLEKLLNKRKELIDMLDSNNLTALIYAARGGHSKSVKLLLERGANLAVKDQSVNRTAVDIIMSNVPRAVEIINDVLDSSIVPGKNALLVESTMEALTENNQVKEQISNQETERLLDEHNKNQSEIQVTIDMPVSDSTVAKDNIHDNSIDPKKNNQQASKNKENPKDKRKNNKKVTNKEDSSYMDISNNNKYYKTPMVQLDYKCLVAGSRQLAIIEAVNECKCDKLKQIFFSHPLVKTFLIYKWKQIKNIYLILFFVNLINTLSVTGLALFSTVWQRSAVAIICCILILIMIIPIILVEIVTRVQDAKIYSSFETCIRRTGILLTALFSMITIFWQNSYFASVTVLFSWMNLLLFFAMRCNEGFYIILFFKIVKNIFQVLSLFFFLIVGFALCFFILFNGRKPFSDPLTAFGTVIAMISELKYVEIFDKETDLILIILGRILFIVFYVVVVMVMMNLIIGLSVNIITEHEGKCKHLAMQGSFLCLVDKFCWDGESDKFITTLREFFQRFNKQIEEKERFNSLTIYPNQPSKNNIFEKELIFEVMEIVHNKANRYRIETMVQKMHQVGERVDEVIDIVNKRN